MMSALWSSLRTLELTRQLTSTHEDPAKFYHTSFPGHHSDKKVHKRHQKLATALAHIGASSPDAKTVTACSVEVSYPNGNPTPMVILRIAQNNLVGGEELAKLQTLVDDLVQEIWMQQASLLADNNRACNFVSLRLKILLYLHPERRDTIQSIAVNFFLPRIVERCQGKISHILNGPYSKPFRDWYADIVNSGTTNPIVLECSHSINRCSSDHVTTFKNADEVVDAIAHAYVISEGFADSLEPQWASYGSKAPRDEVTVSRLETKEEGVQGEQIDGGRVDREEENTEDLDDRESLDPEVLKKSSVYRFLRKLSRYHIACSLITSEVVALLRVGAGRNIKVETVPISTTTSTPANENEHASFDSFFERCVRTDLNSLDPMKVSHLRDSWSGDTRSKNLFLHAEMQMALFYALNPQLYPIQGFMGVSKKCCWCCDFVLKSVTPFNFVSPCEIVCFTDLLDISNSLATRTRDTAQMSPAPLFSSRSKGPITANIPLGYSPTLQHISSTRPLTTSPSTEFAADSTACAKTWRMPF